MNDIFAVNSISDLVATVKSSTVPGFYSNDTCIRRIHYKRLTTVEHLIIPSICVTMSVYKYVSDRSMLVLCMTYAFLLTLASTFGQFASKYNFAFVLVPYKFYVLGQIGRSKQCRPRSDCF